MHLHWVLKAFGVIVKFGQLVAVVQRRATIAAAAAASGGCGAGYAAAAAAAAVVVVVAGVAVYVAGVALADEIVAGVAVKLLAFVADCWRHRHQLSSWAASQTRLASQAVGFGVAAAAVLVLGSSVAGTGSVVVAETSCRP